MDEFTWLYDIGFIRWLSRFFTEEKLGPFLGWFKRQMAGRTPGQMAGKLFGWAIALAVLATVIDQAVYWTRSDQKNRVRRFVGHIRVFWRRFYRALRRRLAQPETPGTERRR